MTDGERDAITLRMRVELMKRSQELFMEQRGKHAVEDVLPLLWLSLADITGRNIAVGRNTGALDAPTEPVVTAIACAVLQHGVRAGQDIKRFSFDWSALLTGTTKR